MILDFLKLNLFFNNIYNISQNLDIPNFKRPKINAQRYISIVENIMNYQFEY